MDDLKFGFDKGDEFADVLEAVYFLRREFYLEGLLDRQNKAYMAKAIPAIDIIGRRLGLDVD
jgi:hypothetical protein